ncbi:MAG: cofactor-independent phosphoglycerate mutase [Spirochaetales bacterium]|nr:cofactor-independent phosphoglycerate mutase [Spirochaetales bacterium]
MKYAVIITDGAADIRLDSLGGKTPLEAADIPFCDKIAAMGKGGTVQTVPEGLDPGSDVAIMSLLGNNPLKSYTGRAPIEAAARGLTLSPGEWAFRCNLVTIVNNIMIDHSAGNITNNEAKALMEEVNKRLGGPDIRFFSGVSYRNLLLLKTNYKGKTTPPHDILDKPIDNYLPKGEGSESLRKLIAMSSDFLPSLPINQKRKNEGKNIASSIWFWGEGTAPKITPFADKFGINGAIIAAVDLVRGLGMLMGWTPIEVKGATGFVDTNYKGKGEAAVEALKTTDIVAIHIEAPDEAGHAGNPEEKVMALEQIDKHIAGPVLSYLVSRDEPWRILIMPDHPTPCTIRTHTREAVPFLMAGDGVESNGCRAYTEAAAKSTGLFIDAGYKIMEMLIRGE